MLPEGYPDDPGTIENMDGSPITIRDFITGVRRYLKKHKQLIVTYRLMLTRSTDSSAIPESYDVIPLRNVKPSNDWTAPGVPMMDT